MIGETDNARLASNSISAEPGDTPPDLAAAGNSRVARRECASCGYEPADQRARPRHACPKCFSWAWTTVVRSAELRTSDHRWHEPKSYQRQVFRFALPTRG